MGWSGASNGVNAGRGSVSRDVSPLGVDIFVAVDKPLALLLLYLLLFGLIFVCGILYYKNVSFVIAKRLLRETNVVIILVFGLCNWMY